MTVENPARSRLAELVAAAASVAGQTGKLEVLRTTIETAMELTGARYGALGVIGEHGTLVDFVHVGLPDEDAARIERLPEGRGLLGMITRAGRAVRVDDIAAHGDAAGFPPGHPVMENFLGIPVRVGEAVFGNLYLTDKPGGFDDADEALVESLALIAGSAVSTARLHARLRRLALVEDRERIARELHDSVIQELFAVGLSLQAAANDTETKPDLVRDRILHAVSQLDESITTLRRYIFDIRRRIWSGRDLGDELRDLALQLSAPYEAEVRVSITGTAQDLDDEVVEDALQFAREGVNNALRHSGAPAVDVLVTVGTAEMKVEVRDGGNGFDPATTARGMGLDNMVARAEQAGGSAEVRSRPGHGTIVAAILPLHPAEAT